MNPALSSLRPKKILLIALALCIPLTLLAQYGMESSLAQNASFTKAFALMSPMAISPFWTLFITSFASTVGVGEEYLATNPMLDSWVVLLVSFLLVVFTTLPNLTKVSRPVGLAAKFLEDKSSYVIYAMMMMAPYIFRAESEAQQAVVSLGLFDIPFSVLLMVAFAIPYFMVVMTVRYFFDIMIFLSPIPLLDAFFELTQKGVTLFLVVIYLFFPFFGLVLSLLMFLLALLLFKRAQKVSNYFRHIYVNPLIARFFGRREKLVSEKLPKSLKKQFYRPVLAVKCLTGRRIGKIGSRKFAWLLKEGNELFLCQPRFLRKPRVIFLNTDLSGRLQLSEELYHYILHDEQNELRLLLNAQYKPHIAAIVAELDLEQMGKVGLARQKEYLRQQGKKGVDAILGMFSSGGISQNKGSILDE